MSTVDASLTRATPSVSRRDVANSRFGDRAFGWLTMLMAFSIFVLIVLIGWELSRGATPAIRKFGWHFLVGTLWDPGSDVFGALPFIFGTLVSSAIALLIAVPLSIATAVYLTELAPLWLRQPLVIFIELLAAIPSVILGFWGFYVMVPWLHVHVFPVLRSTLGFLPFFQGPDNGPSILSAGIILAIMVIPIITSVSREILRSVPGLQREAAYALGATRWEVTRIAVLSYAKRGLFGAVILGLGRALGETMAVTMLIGNVPFIGWSVFSAGQTLASVLANEFTEAMDPLHTSALFEVGLVLLGVTLVVNALARVLLVTFAGPSVKPQN
jgi:phosphate transport system permease protein